MMTAMWTRVPVRRSVEQVTRRTYCLHRNTATAAVPLAAVMLHGESSSKTLLYYLSFRRDIQTMLFLRKHVYFKSIH